MNMTRENQVPSDATFALLEAMLNAASKLGIEGIFRKLVVSELPDNLWRHEIEMTETEMGVLVKARHSCPPGCPATVKGCLTALKIEEIVSKRKPQLYEVTSIRRLDESNEIEALLQIFL